MTRAFRDAIAIQDFEDGILKFYRIDLINAIKNCEAYATVPMMLYRPYIFCEASLMQQLSCLSLLLNDARFQGDSNICDDGVFRWDQNRHCPYVA